jgi:hypothetical protein
MIGRLLAEFRSVYRLFKSANQTAPDPRQSLQDLFDAILKLYRFLETHREFEYLRIIENDLAIAQEGLEGLISPQAALQELRTTVPGSLSPRDGMYVGHADQEEMRRLSAELNQLIQEITRLLTD